MSTSIGILNFLVATVIFVILLTNRSRLVEQNWMEGIGHNVMAIACAIISIKVGYALLNDTVKFDVYGLLFRIGFMIFMIGNLCSTYRSGVSLMYKSQKAQCFVARPLEKSESVVV